MSLSTRDRLVAALDRFCGAPAFHAAADAEPGLLDVRVDGPGAVEFPITPTQVGRLRALGAPARYGLGEKTLTDASVRDTWEIPRAAVHVRWGAAFDTILDGMRQGLGLPSSCRLRAEPHSFLLYERGQFFLPHQDSEKDDAMAATLVVVLPSEHEGGELVIEKDGRKVERRGSSSALTLTAFYADCRHEVRPVKSGARIALTFNLLLDGATAQQDVVSAEAVEEVAQLLREHFGTPTDRTLSPAPATTTRASQLACPLDHEYTERGLGWDRLKGGDADRVRLLRAAAEQAGCLVMLALTEVRETWETEPDHASGYRRRHKFYAARDDYDGYDDQDSYIVNDLIESSTRLVHWIDPDGGGEQISLDLKPEEVCAADTSPLLQPYEEEHTGYTGNYGNTLDRWYRRAALVLFPADREAAVRSKASSGRRMNHVSPRTQAVSAPVEAGTDAAAAAPVEAGTDAATAAPVETDSVQPPAPPLTLRDALPIACALDDPEEAALVLRPFRLEHLRIPAGAPLASLTERHGADWTSALLRVWFTNYHAPWPLGSETQRLAWYPALPVLCSTLTADGGPEPAETLVRLAWRRLLATVGPRLERQPSTIRDAGLAKLSEPLAAVVAAAERCQTPARLTEIVRDLGGLGEEATSWIIAALRVAAARASGRLSRGFEPVAAEAVRRLRARLSRPGRAEGDWSLDALTDCSCALCGTLNGFLTDRTRRVFEWRLATRDRRHVHTRIGDAGLPVSHETRRTGSPFTMVLTKKETLFTDPRAARWEDEADLAWLGTFWGPSGPPR